MRHPRRLATQQMCRATGTRHMQLGAPRACSSCTSNATVTRRALAQQPQCTFCSHETVVCTDTDTLCACAQNLDWLTADMVAGRVVFGQAELEDATRQVITLVAPLCAPQLAPWDLTFAACRPSLEQEVNKRQCSECARSERAARRSQPVYRFCTAPLWCRQITYLHLRYC